MSTPRWMQGKPVEEKQKPRWMQGRAVDSAPLARNTAMDLAAERANVAFRSNQPIAPDDLTQLGRMDFSPAAMSRLPPVIPNAQAEEEGQAWLSAMEKGGKEKRAYDAAVRQEKIMRQLPDSDFKERLIIAMNVPTYGSGPRLAAGAQTVGALLATPFVEDDIIDREGVSGAMSQFLDEARTHQRRARTERPVESIGIEVVPSLFQGKTIIDTLGKKVLPGTSTLSNVSRVAGVGTGYGALYAGSQNESGTVEGVARDAAVGGALGAGFGLGFKAAEPAVTAGYRSAKTGAATISDALSELLGKAGGARDKVAQEVALAAVRRSMERSGMTFDKVMELVKRYEGKPAVLAEVIGQDAVNALTALTRRPGSTPQKAQDIIEERFFERPARMAADVEEATGIQIGQLDSTLDAQLIARQEAAKPVYDALYKQYGTIKSFGESLKRINRLARTPAMQKHLTLAEEAVKTQAALREIPVSKMSKMEYWDLVKRSLDDEINSAVAKGEARTKVGASVADLTQLKSAITDEFDRLTDGAYAAARQAGGEAPRLRAAAVAGQKALGARNARETAKTVAATLPQDVAGFRAGVVDDLGTRIERGMVPGRVRLPDVANKLRAALGDEPANRIISRFDAEANLAESGANWAPRMKSPTGTVMESGPSAFGDDLVNAGMNLATGNKLGLLRQAINFMRQRGFSQRQIDAIGDLLLSSPEEGLRRLQVIKPDGPPAGLAAPIAGGAPPVPPAGGSASGRTVGKGKLGTRTSGIVGNNNLTNAAFGAGLGGIAPAESPEERARNMAIGAGIGIAGGSRTVGKVLGVKGDDVARTAGLGGSGSGNAGRFRFGLTGKAFNPYSRQVQDEIIRTSGGTVTERNIEDLMSVYTDDLLNSTPQEIVDNLRRQAGEIPMSPRDVEYAGFAELMARQLTPIRPDKAASPILTAGAGGGRKPPKPDSPEAIRESVRKVSESIRAKGINAKPQPSEMRVGKGMSKLTGIKDDPAMSMNVASDMLKAGRSPDEIWTATQRLPIKIEGRTILVRGAGKTPEDVQAGFWQEMAKPYSKRASWAQKGTEGIFPMGSGSIARQPLDDRLNAVAKRLSTNRERIPRRDIWEETGVVVITRGQDGQMVTGKAYITNGFEPVALMDAKQFKTFDEAQAYLDSIPAMPRADQPDWYRKNFSQVLDAGSLRRLGKGEVAARRVGEQVLKHPRVVGFAAGSAIGASGVIVTDAELKRRQAATRQPTSTTKMLPTPAAQNNRANISR